MNIRKTGSPSPQLKGNDVQGDSSFSQPPADFPNILQTRFHGVSSPFLPHQPVHTVK